MKLVKYALPLLLTSSAAFANSIPEAGNPNFVNEVNIGMSDWREDGYKITAEGDDLKFNLGEDSYNVEDGSYKLTAYFDSNGDLDTAKSNVQVRGYFDDQSLDKLSNTELQHELWGGNLFSARLDDMKLEYHNGELTFGFRTTDFGGWASQYGTIESVWFSDFDPKAKNFLALIDALEIGELKATAVTTVPLPAGIWLLGSALAGYITVGRRSKGYNLVS